MLTNKLFAVLLAICTICDLAEGTGADSSDKIEDPEDLRNFTTKPPISGVLQEDSVDWESWAPSQVVAQAFPSYRSGYDRDGLVVHVVEFGRHNFRAFAKRSQERVTEGWKAWEQWIRFMEKDGALNNGQGIVIIVDFDGFTLASYASQEALKFCLKIFSYLSRTHRALKYGFFLNVNYAAESWLNLARPFCGQFLDVFELCGTRSDIWKPKLLRKIPASQLAPKYGGSNDWRCLPPEYRC